MGYGGSQALSLARNIVIARCIGPSEFGVAATLGVTASLIDMLSDLAVDKLLIQSSDGDDERMQSNAHSLQVCRGALAAVAILLIAGPMAALFNAPEAITAYRWLALFPLLRGLAHLDIVRRQRRLRFGPAIVVEVASQAAALAAAWPLAIMLRDHRAALIVILLQALAFVVGSHVAASRRFRLGWDRPIIARFARFGWPLLLNGVLMWVIFQGDKVIVGAAYSREQLGVYAAAFGLALLPGLLLARVNRALFLPLLSKEQSNPERFRLRYAASSQFTSSLAAGLGVGAVVAGPSLLVALYGERFHAGGAVVALIGWMTAVRVARGTPSVAAIALGDTTNPVWANLARMCSLVMGVGVAAAGQPVAMVALSGVVGEAAAMLVATWRLATVHKIPWRITLTPCLTANAIAAALCLLALLAPADDLAVRLPLGAFGAAMAMGAVALTGPELRNFIRARTPTWARKPISPRGAAP